MVGICCRSACSRDIFWKRSFYLFVDSGLKNENKFQHDLFNLESEIQTMGFESGLKR